MSKGVPPGEGQGQVAAQPGDEDGEGEQEVVADLLHEGVDRPGYGGGGPQSGRRGEGVDPSQRGGAGPPQLAWGSPKGSGGGNRHRVSGLRCQTRESPTMAEG